MKSSLVAFSLMTILVALDSFASETLTIDRSQLEIKQGVTYKKGESVPFSGKVVSSYANGQKKSEFHYQNGKRHGKVTFWYKSGQKEREEYYQNGIRHGIAPTGTPTAKGAACVLSVRVNGKASISCGTPMASKVVK